MLQWRASELGDWDSFRSSRVLTQTSNTCWVGGRRNGTWRARASVAHARTGSGPASHGHSSMRAVVELRLGNDAAVGPLLREARDTAEAIRAGLNAADVDVVAGLRALELDDAVAAESLLRRAGQRMLDEGYVGLFRRNVLADWAEALVVAGRLEEATALIADHEDDLRRLDTPAGARGDAPGKGTC